MTRGSAALSNPFAGVREGRRGVSRATLLRLLAALAVAGLVGAATSYAIERIGPFGAIVPLAACTCLVLLGMPRLTLAVLLVTTVLFENDPRGFLPFETLWYSRFAQTVSPTDILFVILIVGTGARLVQRGERPRLPPYFTLPIALLAVAVMAGAITSVSNNGVVAEMFNAVRILTYLGLLPIVVVNLVRDERDVRMFMGVIGGIAAYKGLEGTFAYVIGAGRTVNGTALTYFDPTAIWVLTVFMLTLLAARLSRVRLPHWTVWVLPLTFAAVLFSYRRSYWLAAALGAAIVCLVVIGQRGRVVIAGGTVLLVIAAVLSSATGGTLSALQQSQNPIAKRVLTFTPSQQSNRKEDLYRVAERSNFWQEISRHPLSGLGFGVPWRSFVPVPVWFKGQHTYGHFVSFLFWLRMGVLGFAAYFVLMGAGMLAGYRNWRRDSSPLIRCGGVAVMAGTIGLVLAETQGSQTGQNLRLTLVEGVMFGLLAAASANRGGDATRLE